MYRSPRYLSETILFYAVTPIVRLLWLILGLVFFSKFVNYIYSNTARRCKQPDFKVKITMQRCNNYSTVLFIIQFDTVIYTELYCKQITTVTSCNIYSALLASVLPVQYCKFTTQFLQCTNILLQ